METKSEFTGGPAFPGRFKELDDDTVVPVFPGMSLRDYLAAKAMQGLLSDSRLLAKWQEFAEDAYEMADAMLKARAKWIK